MKLLLDVGNTAIKWACLEQGRLQQSGQFLHNGCEIPELAAQAWAGLPVPDAVHAACVAGDACELALTAWARQHWQCEVVFAETGSAGCGVTSGYAQPEALGIDRWVALIGVHHALSRTACVIDCGTAITVDLILANGTHRGGMILPGVMALRQLMQENTARIRITGDVQPAAVLSDNTGSAVDSGALYIAASAVDRVLNDLREQAGEPVTVVITGGDAEPVMALLDNEVVHIPDLVLQGLAVIADEGCQ